MRTLALVALVGCWRGSTPPPTPEPVTNTTSPRRRAPIDAAEPAEVEWSPPDAMIIVSSPMPSCPSGIGFAARVVGLHITSSHTVITIGRGNTSGITPAWTVELSTQPPTPATIIRIDNNTTIAQVTVPAAVVQTSPQVVFCAP